MYAHKPFGILRKFFLLCFGHLFCVMVWCVAFLAAANISIKAFVCPSVFPSLCEHVSSPITMVFYQMIRNTNCLWLPSFQGHMSNFKVTQPKNLVKLVKFRVFGHFQENAWDKGLKFGMLMYPDHQIRFWSRSVDFTNFGGILAQ